MYHKFANKCRKASITRKLINFTKNYEISCFMNDSPTLIHTSVSASFVFMSKTDKVVEVMLQMHFWTVLKNLPYQDL